MREHHIKVKHYARMYVTLQDDGSEDDLSYIKLYNYGGKVITNRMHGYLRMRIAQFLTTVHTTPHVIYLSRHGQSEYNVMGKIGGNPPLSTAGEEYARRLGKWVPDNICRTPDGRPIKSRLWTSSLQRTILTAEHIPHPLIPCRELFDAYGNEIHSSSSLVLADGWRGHPSSPTADGVVSFGIMPTHPATLAATLAADASRGLGKMPTPPSPLPSRMPSEATLADPPALKLEHSESGPASSEPPTEPSELDGVLHSEELWEQMSPRVYRNLDEIFAGEYEGMSYEDIERLMPEEASLRSMDKIGYRYPRGESYFDILARLDPLVHEMESYREPVLIVSHQAVLRVLYAYLMAKPRSSAPKIEIPLHTIMKITYDGWNPPYEERVYLGPEPLSESPDKPANDGQKKL
jgi:broad specificity phosphatase PhoE